MAKQFVAIFGRYGRGFGVLGDLLGDEHPLNVNNAVYGILFYACIALLGME